MYKIASTSGAEPSAPNPSRIPWMAPLESDVVEGGGRGRPPPFATKVTATLQNCDEFSTASRCCNTRGPACRFLWRPARSPRGHCAPSCPCRWRHGTGSGFRAAGSELIGRICGTLWTNQQETITRKVCVLQTELNT